MREFATEATSKAPWSSTQLPKKSRRYTKITPSENIDESESNNPKSFPRTSLEPKTSRNDGDQLMTHEDVSYQKFMTAPAPVRILLIAFLGIIVLSIVLLLCVAYLLVVRWWNEEG